VLAPFNQLYRWLTITPGRLSPEVTKRSKIIDFFVLTAPKCSYLSIDYHSD